MNGARSALIVASETYEDPQLAALRAPGRDAEQLAAVLRDPAIGGFHVSVSMNQRHYEVRLALEDFFADRGPEDVLLLHFSCHGIKDEAGRLFFAAADTQKNRLNATGIAADYVNDLLNRARSRRVVLFLDCCFSGAFTRGMLARSGPSLDVTERFQGRGRAVLTASGALEYAWEGDALTRLNAPSVFTSAVVQGLRSGEADRDGDQQISVDELYDYVYDAVRRVTPNQTPGKWSNVEGALIVARSPLPAQIPATPPAESREPAADEPIGVRTAVVEPAGPRGVALRLEAPQRTGEAVARPAWMPAVVLAGGWMVAWLVSLSLATSAAVESVGAGAALALLGWALVSPLVAAALRWAVPGLSLRRALLVGLGWPACMALGLAAPLLLRLGSEGAVFLGLGVTAAGLAGAVALAPPDEPVPWERVLTAAAGWCAGWLWSGTTAWPLVFWRLANEYDPTLAASLENVSFLRLIAGGALSGLGGGVLMYLLLRPSQRGAGV